MVRARVVLASKAYSVKFSIARTPPWRTKCRKSLTWSSATKLLLRKLHHPKYRCTSGLVNWKKHQNNKPQCCCPWFCCSTMRQTNTVRAFHTSVYLDIQNYKRYCSQSDRICSPDEMNFGNTHFSYFLVYSGFDPKLCPKPTYTKSNAAQAMGHKWKATGEGPVHQRYWQPASCQCCSSWLAFNCRKGLLSLALMPILRLLPLGNFL